MSTFAEQEPVIVGGAVAIIGAVLTPIVAKAGIDSGGALAIAGGIGAVLTGVIAVLGVGHARKASTPLANPTTNDGVQLVPFQITHQIVSTSGNTAGITITPASPPPTASAAPATPVVPPTPTGTTVESGTVDADSPSAEDS